MPKSSPKNSPDQQEINPAEMDKSQELPITPTQEAETAESVELSGAQKETKFKPTSEVSVPLTTPFIAPKSVAPKIVKNKDLVLIENILSEDLADAYAKLPPDKKKAFRQEGEKAAYAIWQMVESAKIQVQKIVELIRKWLRKLPGINKFFLEQETKLKIDKIIALAKQHGTKRDATNN